MYSYVKDYIILRTLRNLEGERVAEIERFGSFASLGLSLHWTGPVSIGRIERVFFRSRSVPNASDTRRPRLCFSVMLFISLLVCSTEHDTSKHVLSNVSRTHKGIFTRNLIASIITERSNTTVYLQENT